MPWKSCAVPTGFQILENVKYINFGGSDYEVGRINERRHPGESEDRGCRNTQIIIIGRG